MTKQERERLAAEYQQLLVHTGVSRKARNLLDEYWLDGPGFLSDSRYRCGMREIVFGVSDINLRKQVIRLYRQLHSIEMTDHEIRLWEAQRQMRNVERAGAHGLLKSMAGGLLVVVGWLVWGWVGAFAIGVAAVILTLYDLRRVEQE